LNVIISSFFSLNKFLYSLYSYGDFTFSVDSFEGLDVDFLWLKIFVVLEFIEGLGEVLMWWSMVFVHWKEGWPSFFVGVLLPVEISVSNGAVSWLPMIVGVSFVVMEMREGCGVRVAHEHWEVRISIIDSIDFLSFHESENVVFNNWALGHGGSLGSSDVSSDSISKSKDVFESFVLKGIWVYINQTIGISNSTIDEVLPWFTWWVKVSVSETWFDNFSTVNIFESGNLFSDFTGVNFQKFPSKHNLDSSLVAFFKSNFVSVTKFIDFFVWSPVLDFRGERMSSLDLILSQPWFVVESIEIISFTLVWSFWRIADHVSTLMVPSMVVVSSNGFLIVQHMNVDIVLFWSSSHFWESFNMSITVIEAWSNNKGFISVFLSVSENNFILVWMVSSNSNSKINFGPFLNLTVNICWFSLIRRESVMCARNILCWNNEFTLFGNNGHFVFICLWLTLNLLSDGGGISSSDKNNVKISFFIAHCSFLWTSTHSSSLCVDKSSANLSLS